ncbi:UNVERIFIED_CONTAM: hypothetical protein Sindi_0731000 [Sesamum indicum]
MFDKRASKCIFLGYCQTKKAYKRPCLAFGIFCFAPSVLPLSVDDLDPLDPMSNPASTPTDPISPPAAITPSSVPSMPPFV